MKWFLGRASWRHGFCVPRVDVLCGEVWKWIVRVCEHRLDGLRVACGDSTRCAGKCRSVLVEASYIHFGLWAHQVGTAKLSPGVLGASSGQDQAGAWTCCMRMCQCAQ